MRLVLLAALIGVLAPTAYAQNDREISKKAPKLISDQYYWWGDEGNIGIALTGKFQSLEKMADTFRLLREIGTFKNRPVQPQKPVKWRLCDILVSVDFNSNGHVAMWEVSGPKPLLLHYLENLKKKYVDRSLFYDFSYSFVNFKPTAFFEREE